MYLFDSSPHAKWLNRTTFGNKVLSIYNNYLPYLPLNFSRLRHHYSTAHIVDANSHLFSHEMLDRKKIAANVSVNCPSS